MNWTRHFPELKRQPPPPPHEPVNGPLVVQRLRDIPAEAALPDVFRIPVEVIRVDRQETRNGDPCYFVNVRDSTDIKFSVVCWDWQWAAIRDGITEGRHATLDVRVPEGKFRSFRLALPPPRKDRTRS